MLHLASTHTMSCADEWQGSTGAGELKYHWRNVCNYTITYDINCIHRLHRGMSCADEWQGSAGTGELRHRWSNVCMHHFSLAFLERMAGHMEHRAPFHQAHKSIPSLHGPVKVPGQLQNVLPILIPPSQKAADAAHLQGLHWRIWAAPVPACDLAYRQL